MGHGGDRLGRAEFAAEATILCTEITLTRSGCHVPSRLLAIVSRLA
jgi:hypothetical protein